MRIRRLLASAAAAAALLAACGNDDTSTSSATQTQSSGSDDGGVEGDVVDFTATDVFGTEVNVSELAIQKDVVVWFWAPW